MCPDISAASQLVSCKREAAPQDDVYVGAQGACCPHRPAGYSTCHWCHVMERESFESEEVAALM